MQRRSIGRAQSPAKLQGNPRDEARTGLALPPGVDLEDIALSMRETLTSETRGDERSVAAWAIAGLSDPLAVAWTNTEVLEREVASLSTEDLIRKAEILQSIRDVQQALRRCTATVRELRRFARR